MAENKVNYGLNNTHYATYTIGENGTVTFGTPKPIPGSVEISLEPRGDLIEFYADNMLYYSAPNNQGYDGTLTIASIPETFSVDCLGEVLDEEDGVVTELATAKGKPFALLFEFDGDVKGTRHLLYSCTANRPTVGSSTKTDSAEPNTNELSFVSSPIILAGDKATVKTKTTTSTPDDIYNTWFSTVYQKSQATGE